MWMSRDLDGMWMSRDLDRKWLNRDLDGVVSVGVGIWM